MLASGLRRSCRHFVSRLTISERDCHSAGVAGFPPPNRRQFALLCRALSRRAENDLAAPSTQTIEAHLGALTSKPSVPESGPIVLIISGPSGVGKDAVIKQLREKRPELAFVVTATSRKKRPGEVHGKDYLFVTKQHFENWLQEGSLLEHAVVYGEYKGIPRYQVEQALQDGTDVVLRVDVQGAEAVRLLMPGAVSVFLVAESEAELVERLVARKTEPLDKLLVRIKTARDECTYMENFDYVVVNREGRLDKTVEAILAVLEAEKLKTWRRTGTNPS